MKTTDKATTYFVTEELPPNFRWDPTCPVRGTDRFYVRTAEETVRTGRNVVVVYDGPTTVRNGVTFRNRREHDTSCPDADEVWLMNPRSAIDIASYRGGTIRIWTNFYFDHPETYREWIESLDVAYDDLVVISAAARKLMPGYLNPRIVPHGIDHGFYAVPTAIPNADKVKTLPERRRQVVFSSSPDCGLDYLKNLWREQAIEAKTGYRLVTTTYGDSAKTNDRKLRQLLWESDFWVHPGHGYELFSLAAVEAQAAGCTPIVVPSGGLAQTVRHGYRFTNRSFEAGLLAVLSGEAVMADVTASHVPSWRDATATLLGWFSLVI
jgi:glycosyltransferase involved in cell wall biosynthesis